MLRVNSILKQVIAEEVERMNDSRLDLVSVTGVDTSPNLRTAMVYIDVLSDEPDQAIAALRGASRRIQARVGSEVRMKYTPTLDFALDPGIVGGERIDSLLREIAADPEEE